ncbi:C4-dicarboxylate TRAP transporter substrate-binding protein [Pseudovibrio sp. Tun.PSC04-5.I4]|uniref:C4-dicarboxylate TRAP transporter substrate-binding protein n=1 Tax=Pseudovibrio sp. Tun.PSC04-5.I4 TaxID=1798213 RepID=UPI000AFEBB7A|nr:C4-dicarboxylate TRAP transporter substrate-binding protein [Pseudovibrio sp. Tun.PSC04-5.I4]
MSSEKNLSRVTKLALIASLAVGGAFIGSAANAETFSLRVGSGHPVKGLSHMEALENQFLPEIAKRVEERTEHKIKWTKAYAGSLVKLPETLSATQKGLLDIGVINFPHITELFVQNFPFYFPFQTGDAVMATKAVRATFDQVPWLKESFEKNYNQKLLAIGANGNYGIGTTFPFEKFEDLKGKKVGAGGPNLLWFEGTGVAPVTTNLGEAYNALKSGIYDGLVIFPGPYYGFKLQEVGKNFTVANFGSPSALSINVNLDKWNTLPKDV